MRRLPSVRTTLLDALFRRPAPISKTSYKEAQTQLFPGRASFQRFLTTTDHQELHFYARAILTQLANHHYAVPPTRLLSNLADFEDKAKDVIRKGDYVPQDHYVHLVNLYLLGIYLFSYHRGIHRFCSAELGAMRRQFLGKDYVRKGRRSGRRTNYHLFAAAWAQFVLFHDLAYPLERIPSLERAEKNAWTKPFSRIHKSLLKDSALRALVRLVVAQDLLRCTGAALSQTYLDHEERVYLRSTPSGRATFIPVDRIGNKWQGSEARAAEMVEESLSAWNDSLLLYRVRSSDAVRTLGPLLPDESLAAVLEASTGAPYLIVFKDRQRSPIWFSSPQDLPRSVPREADRCWEYAFLDATPPTADSAWHYFVRGPEEALGVLVQGTEGLDVGDLQRIHDRLADDEDFREAGLVSAEPASAQIAIGFDRLSRILGYADDEAVERVGQIFSGYESGFRSAAGRLHGLASSVIGELIKEQLEQDKEFKPLSAVSRGTEAQRAKIITEFVWGVFDSAGRDQFQSRIAQSVSKEIVRDVAFEESVRQAHQAIRGSLRGLLLPDGEDAPPAEFPLPFNKVLQGNKGLATSDADTPFINEELLTRGLPSFQMLAETYRPLWAQESSDYRTGFIDHGLGSAAVAISTAAFFNKAHSILSKHAGSKIPPEISLLRLSMGTTSSLDEDWLRLEIAMLNREVATTVALHNLYPARLPGAAQAYRTRISREPFTFLALFADGLQKWDRQALIDLPRSEAVRLIPGNRFDLQIVGDLVHVLIVGTRIDLEAEDRRVRTILRDYLDDADQLIRVDIAQTREAWR